MSEELKRLNDLRKALDLAEKKARSRDLSNTNNSADEMEIQKTLLEAYNTLTGKKHFIAEEKDPFSGEPFNQTIHRNLDLLNQIDYLTQAEGNFLFKIQAYLEFKSNVIICREEKFKKKKKQSVVEDDEGFSLPKAATITDISEMLNITRANVSKTMNSLKQKEILLNPEGAGMVIENGRTVTPRTWIVNPYIMICAPRKNQVKLDTLTIRLFQHSLKNLTDKKGNKVKLPARFF